MPVPDGAIHEYLSRRHYSRSLQNNKRRNQRCDAEEQVDGMGNRDDVEEVAARVEAGEGVVRQKLRPRYPLAGEKKRS